VADATEAPPVTAGARFRTMVGLVVATHGRLAEELIATAVGIVGQIEQARAISVGADASMEDARARLGEAIEAVDSGDGVLVLTDMFGGTPANLALTFLDDKIEVVTGVNLPMLVKLATARVEGMSPAAAAELVTAYGQKNITLASELLRTRARTTRR
jgi:PTS system mannose-specific IIA component